MRYYIPFISSILVLLFILFIISIIYRPYYCNIADEMIINKCIAHLIEFDMPPDDIFDDEEYFRIIKDNSSNGGFKSFDVGSGGSSTSSNGTSSGGFYGHNRHYWIRPWRNYWWNLYPQYIPTFPITYSNNWSVPTRFKVRLGPKTIENPNYNKGSKYAYMLSSVQYNGCGNSGAYLELYRGQTYEFDIYTASDCVSSEPLSIENRQPFFFTTSKEGGAQIGELFTKGPVVNGVLRITITDDLPNEFYYQSTNDKYVGGTVYIKN